MAEVLYDNVVMGYGGANAHTIYVREHEEVLQKNLTVVEGIKSKTNRDGDLPTNRALDLLRHQQRFNYTGYIDSSDRTKFKTLVNTGGPTTMRWENTSYTVHIEKYALRRDGSNKQDEWEIRFTVVVANDL